MAIFKCKECGGEIEPQENGLGKCLYCGAVQTLPKDKDDKIQNLLNRANDFRLNCDFDRAIFEYEEALKLSETEPEAHWGLFLSKYGVEYVKDNMTFTYKPTLHRISSISVFDDVDYKATIKYADSISAMQYKKDAENIEMVMKELLLLSANQEPYDVFLSYKELDDITRQRTDDSYLAHDLYKELTSQGYKVFFAPKSLGVGLFEPKIYSAIISSKIMIVLGTQPKYFDAIWVKNEWSRFAELIDNGEQKVLVPVFKNMEAGQLPNRLAKYQALDMSNISFLQTLTGIIAQSVNHQSRVNFNKDSSAEEAYLERGFLALEDRDFTQANIFFENALNLNPHSSQAYFGKLMVEMRISKQEQILTSSKLLKEYANFEKAVRFADQQLKSILFQYEEKVSETLSEQKYISELESEKQKIESLNKKIDDLKLDENKKEELQENEKRRIQSEIDKKNDRVNKISILVVTGIIVWIVGTIIISASLKSNGDGGIFGFFFGAAVGVAGLLLLYYSSVALKDNLKDLRNITEELTNYEDTIKNDKQNYNENLELLYDDIKKHKYKISDLEKNISKYKGYSINKNDDNSCNIDSNVLNNAVDICENVILQCLYCKKHIKVSQEDVEWGSINCPYCGEYLTINF